MKQETIVTPKDIMEHFGYSQATYYNRRRECLASPYADAIITDHHKPKIILERWTAWLKWQSRKNYEEKLGLNNLRNRI